MVQRLCLTVGEGYMKIAICDDERKDIEILRKHITTHRKTYEIVEFTSANSFLQRVYSGEHFDLLFLDIQMPDADGWKIAKELKQKKIKIYIAMVTVLGDYICDCFDRVDWFASKPISAERAKIILDNAQEKLFPTVFKFETEKLTLSLTAPEIIYVEAVRNYLFIHTANNKYPVRMTLKDFLCKFDNLPCFVQTYKSIIINLDYYDSLEGCDIILKRGEQIPLSRNFRKHFYEALEYYIGSG